MQSEKDIGIVDIYMCATLPTSMRRHTAYNASMFLCACNMYHTVVVLDDIVLFRVCVVIAVVHLLTHFWTIYTAIVFSFLDNKERFEIFLGINVSTL